MEELNLWTRLFVSEWASRGSLLYSQRAVKEEADAMAMRATRYFSIGRDGCRVRERAKKREEWRELRLRLHASLQCPSILHWFSFSPFSYRPFFLFFHPLSIEPVAERSWTEQTLKRQIGSRTQFRIFTLLVVLFFLLIS